MKEDEAAWNHELIRDLPLAKREAIRVDVVELCDVVPTVVDNRVHPEELALTGVFDVSQKVLNSYFFGFGGSDHAWDVDELAVDSTVVVCFFL